MRNRASANLDLLRSVAVLLVLTQHLCRRTQVGHIGWIPTSSLGLFGVLLFFVHTSLVLLNSMERTSVSGWALYRNFYIRRFFRIYPLSVFIVLIAIGIGIDSDIHGVAGLSLAPRPGVVSIVSHLFLIQNIMHVKSIVNVLWSLPFEIQMYVILPLIFTWIQEKARWWHVLVCWIASLLIATIQPHISVLSRLSILGVMPNFLGGAIAFVVPRKFQVKSFLWPLLILFLVSIFNAKPSQPMGWALCLILGLLIPQFDEIRTNWLKAASQQIAKYSYGIYLSHQFCIWICLGLLANWPLWFRVSSLVVLIVTIPIVLYHTIEKPMIDMGIRIAKRNPVGGIERTSLQAA